MKIWAKTFADDRMIQNGLVEITLPFTMSNFSAILREVCEALDLDTPVALPSHFKHLKRFNNLKLLPSDFVAPVSFECMRLEVVY